MEQRSGSIGQTVLQMVAQKWFTLCYQTIFCPALSLLVFCGQTVGRIKRKLGMVVGLQPQPHCVRWGASFPPPKKKGHSRPPTFVPCLLWPNGWTHQDATGTWYGVRPRPCPHCVRSGPSSPKKGHSSTPTFQPMYCHQTAGWIKVPLGTDIGLSPGSLY